MIKFLEGSPLTEDTLAKNEKAICNLIDAAIDIGIISVQDSDRQNGYFKFNFEKEDTVYEIRIGRNPEKTAAHSTAERAVRASEFVSRILGIIRNKYNCFVVPSREITPPSAEAVKERLFGSEDKVRFFGGASNRQIDVKFVREVADDVKYTSPTYEIELEINATVGNVYKRMVDSLSVTLDDGKASYVYMKREQDVFFDDPRATLDVVNGDYIGNIVRILDGIVDSDGEAKSDTKKRNDNIRAMLDAFAKAKGSELYKFLNEESVQGERVNVGQISVTPCMVAAITIPEKTFEYEVTVKGSKPMKLTIVWNTDGDSFGKDTRLYIRTDDKGKFVGLTYKSRYERGNNEIITLPELENDNSIVAAYVIENGKSEADTLELSKAVKLAKGYSSYAIKVTDVSASMRRDADKSDYYRLDQVEDIDGGKYLSEDCTKCAFTGIRHWKGKLTEALYLKGEKMARGDVFASSIPAASKKKCPVCGTEFYATDADYDKYIKKYTLLDGTVYCEKCNKEISTASGKTERRTVRKTDSSQKGELYVKLAGNGSLLPINGSVTGGNAFECVLCKDIIYYNTRSSDRDQFCDLCNKRICKCCKDGKSFVNLSGDRVTAGITNIANYLSAGTSVARRCCPRNTGKGITEGRHKGKLLYSAVNGKGAKVWVLDKADEPEYLFHCPECQNDEKECTYNDNTLFSKCDCCGRLMHKSCYDKIEPIATLGMRVCRDCRSTQDGSYETAKARTEAAIRGIRIAVANVEKKTADLTREWQLKVLGDIKRYIPDFTLSDGMKVRAAIKNRKLYELVTVVVRDASTDDGDYVRYTINVKGGKRYHYVYAKGKITAGGHDNA